jgi:hypothetical protein
LCSQYYIKDLGRKVHKKEVFYLSEEEANLSKDLHHARKIGAVKVDWVRRYRELRDPMTTSKQPPPPFVAGYRPQIPKPLPPTQVDLEEIRNIVREEFALMKVEIMEGLQVILGQIEVPLTLDEETLQRIANAVPVERIPVPPTGYDLTSRNISGSGTKTDIFIPTDLIPTNQQTELEVESTAEDGNVDSALAALRAIKKKNGDR